MARRHLNIASIVCVVACVALMGMWVRSYWWEDQCTFRPFASHSVYFASEGGRLVLGMITVDDPTHRSIFEARYAPLRDWRSARARIDHSVFGVAGFGVIAPVNHLIVVPHWFAVLLAGSLCFVPWRRVAYRFSLRAMLIGVTLVAVVLGMIAWLDRTLIGK